MKKLKQIIPLTILILSSIILLNCQSEDIEIGKTYVYSSGKINVLESITDNKAKNSTNLSNLEEITVEAIFESNIEIPENLNEDELYDFYEKNKEKIIGSITYKMNDTDIFTSEIINGVEINNSAKSNLNYRSKGDCSYEGVRQCTIRNIDKKSTFMKIVCAFGGSRCVLREAAKCVGEECF